MHRKTLLSDTRGGGEIEVNVVALWNQIETRVRVVEPFHEFTGIGGAIVDNESIRRIVRWEIFYDKVDFLALWHFDGPGAVQEQSSPVG